MHARCPQINYHAGISPQKPLVMVKLLLTYCQPVAEFPLKSIIVLTEPVLVLDGVFLNKVHQEAQSVAKREIQKGLCHCLEHEE
jgi:hypothetical protein